MSPGFRQPGAEQPGQQRLADAPGAEDRDLPVGTHARSLSRPSNTVLRGFGYAAVYPCQPHWSGDAVCPTSFSAAHRGGRPPGRSRGFDCRGQPASWARSRAPRIAAAELSARSRARPPVTEAATSAAHDNECPHRRGITRETTGRFPETHLRRRCAAAASINLQVTLCYMERGARYAARVRSSRRTNRASSTAGCAASAARVAAIATGAASSTG